jgi:hypothetical protein
MLLMVFRRQVCHLLLEATKEQKLAVLVCQRQGLQLVHQLAGMVGASIRFCCLKGREALGGPCCEESVWGKPQAKMARDGCGGASVLREDRILGRLCMEAALQRL